MAVLEFLGHIGNITGIYAFIEEKLKNDYDVFQNQVRKNIIVICE
jgi:hypothetical protein